MKTVEIVSVGNELLRGIVQESNSHWLAKRIAARGADLRRVVVVPDEPAVVAIEIEASIARGTDLLITHGGLGPTDDDRTREAIAIALRAPQELSPDAEAIVRRRYAELAADGAVADAEMNEPRLRMAMLPKGARPLDNHVGGAPGVVATSGRTTLLALPGVPPELFWIWENSAVPLLDEVLGPGGFFEVTFRIESRDESVIASTLQTVQKAHPGVYVKSRAHGFGEEDLLRITLHATGESDGAARALAERARAELREALRAQGISEQDAE